MSADFHGFVGVHLRGDSATHSPSPRIGGGGVNGTGNRTATSKPTPPKKNRAARRQRGFSNAGGSCRIRTCDQRIKRHDYPNILEHP